MSRFSRIDKIAIGEISVNLLGPAPSMITKAKLVSTKNGVSYGSTTIQSWSPTVMQKLEELKQLMEEEMENMFFEEGSETAAQVSKSPTPQGIGEFLDTDELAPPM